MRTTVSSRGQTASDKALMTAAQAIVDTGTITEIPPLAICVAKRFVPETR